MRISDWSSDVCFSDLGITLEEQLFIERGAVASHVAAPPIETNVFRGRLFWLGREPLVEGARYQLRLGSLATEATVQQVERRSEEHTSELQSLMRISYAVFCLKKKQKNKTNTNN